MAIRKKLYYDISVQAVATALNVQLVRRFMAGTGLNFGSDVDLDRYGNVMAPNEFAGATGTFAKAKQAIGAWFQCASGIGGAGEGGEAAISPSVCLDFIAQVGDATTLPNLDPATVRRARLRARIRHSLGILVTIRLSGTIYVQRQHAVEV
jgi:hypothetical protein